MNVLFLSPNFPPQFHLFCRALRDEGVTALGIGDSPPHDVSRALAEAVTEYLYLRDLNQYEDVLKAVGYLTWRHGKIDRVDSLNEHWLPLEARLREDFNIAGPRPPSCAATGARPGCGRSSPPPASPAPRANASPRPTSSGPSPAGPATR